MTDLNTEVPLGSFPKKSSKVARGSIVGGLWNIMEKPAGVEEGMEGVPIAHPKCQKFFQEALSILENQNKTYTLADFNNNQDEFDKFIKLQASILENKALLARFEKIKTNFKDSDTPKEKINLLLEDNNALVRHRYPLTLSEMNKIFFKFGKLHEVNAFRSYYENVGMTGLLFKEYEKSIGVDEKKHFAVQNNTFIDADGNDVLLTKMDGKKMPFFNRTAPGFRRLLKTEVGQNFQILANPFVVVGTAGLSLVGFGALTLGWRGALLARGKISTVNSDVIVETLATKIANLRGFTSQDMRVEEGSYGKPGLLKKIGVIKWAKGVESMSDRLAGGEKNKTNVIVHCDKNENQVRVDRYNNIIRIVPNTQDPKNKEKVTYEKIDEKTGVKTKVKKSEYDKAFSVSEDRIAGLGESLATFICMGDRDGIGEIGQNKLLKKLDKPRGKFTHEFFGIDFGKAYENDKNPILSKKKGGLQDDFSFVNSTVRKERFLNVSILYDNPLREKMKGIYLMAALRNKLDPEQKAKIVAEFNDKNNPAYDPDFAKKLEGYPESLGEKYKTDLTGVSKKTWLQNGDLFLIKAAENQYRGLAAEAEKKLQKKDLTKTEVAVLKNEIKENLAYAARLNQMFKTAKKTDEKMLTVFSKRMNLTPSQIDIIDNLEKLTAKKVQILSPDGKVILNHIRVDAKDRIPWQLEVVGKGNDQQFKLSCDYKNTDVRSKLGSIPEIKAMLNINNMSLQNNELVIVLTKDQLNTLSNVLTEDKVAEVRGLQNYRTTEMKSEFSKNLGLSVPEPDKTAPRVKEKEKQVKIVENKTENKTDSALPPPNHAHLPGFASKRDNVQEEARHPQHTQENSHKNKIKHNKK